MLTDANRKLKRALDDLVIACGLGGAGDAEKIFAALHKAADRAQERWTPAHQANGRELNMVLADAIEEAFIQTKSEVAS